MGKSLPNISFYGSHNSSITVEQDGKILLVLEGERFFNVKNTGISQYKTIRPQSLFIQTRMMIDFICNYLGVEEFENCYHMNTEVIIDNQTHYLYKEIPSKNYIQCLHHRSHSSGCFYQSPFMKSLIFSFDGGGNDGFFNVYLGERDKSVTLLLT